MKHITLFARSAIVCLYACSPNQKILDGESQYQSFAPDGVEFVVADSAWTANKRGNHRAVVLIENIGHHHAASVTLPWRRPDLRPETKKVVVIDAQTDQEIKNVKVSNFSSEQATITFEPKSGNGTYHIYYLPYTYRHGWDDARYGNPWNDYLTPTYQAEDKWVNALNNIEVIEAKLIRFESRSKFDAFTPMGLIATAHEMDSIKRTFPQNPILFTEDRAFPIHLTQHLPARWVKGEDRTKGFSGIAQRGEYYTWQLGVWAAHADLKNVKLTFSDLARGKEIISRDSITCFNQEGTNWDGRYISIPVHVKKDKLQAMWCGVQIPTDAKPGLYKGEIKVTSEGGETQYIPMELHVTNLLLADKGDSDLWRHARLRWLNSTIGNDKHTVTPFKEMNVEGHTITATDKVIKVGENGLPTSIKINNQEILATPLRFIITTNRGEIVLDGQNASLRKEADGLVNISAKKQQTDIQITLNATAEFDGYINYRIQLKPKTDMAVKNICLQAEYTPYASSYFMGAGHSGGKCPTTYRWDWKGPWDSYWIGGTKAGMHVEFRGGTYHGPLLNDYRPEAPRSWANHGKGEIKLKTTANGGTCIEAHTGMDTLPATGREYEFTLMITPARPVNPTKHFSERYYHSAPSGFDAAARQGANIANIHHAQPLNPVINYPFIVQDSLKAFIQHEHKCGRKVKLYYTIRELTNYATEIYALKSLNHEILASGVGYGIPWHCEHLIDDYRPAWYTELEGETSDAALVLSGFSRWINYYLEGLRWMFQNYELDGIYMDDVSFDRPVMKRIRKIIEKYRPGALIDLHSNTTYSIGPANQYTGFFPYIDRLWFGEHFLYNQMTPDEWLVTFSGIPFGLMSEMLQDGGNRFLGMIYGSTARHSYGPFSPTPVWKLWDDFDIQHAEMRGYWEPNCPVKSSDQDVKVTTYIKKDSVLLSIGNFADSDRQVKLLINWKALGMNPDKTILKAPKVEEFQNAQCFQPETAIPVPSKKGWLLLLTQE